MSLDLQNRLKNGLNQLKINLTKHQQTQLLTYLDLLSQWNKTYNLTAIRDTSDMLAAHVFDSLTAQPFLFGNRCVDLGAGAGLPGIPLAIVNPDKQFVLLDSLQKRTRFLSHVSHELQLSNVNVICSRIENYQPDQLFDTLLARALAKCAPLVADSQHLCKPGGRWVLLKGHDPVKECQQLPESMQLLSIDSVNVPELEQTRHIVIVEKERL